MDYWRGWMNWPVDIGWQCETCGYQGLTWGLVHGECRCDRCHSIYTMRAQDDEIVTIPISRLKEEFKEPARFGWEQHRKPLDEFTKEEWDALLNVEVEKQ